MNLPPRRENSTSRLAKMRSAWSANGGASNPSTDPVFRGTGDATSSWDQTSSQLAESQKWGKNAFDVKWDD